MATLFCSIRLTQDICADDLVVLGDITQLQQVILNLVNNAHDALQGVILPEIIVNLTLFTPDAAFKKRCGNKVAKKYAHLSALDASAAILFATGYDQTHVLDEHAIDSNRCSVINKPYAVDKLSQLIRGLID